MGLKIVLCAKAVTSGSFIRSCTQAPIRLVLSSSSSVHRARRSRSKHKINLLRCSGAVSEEARMLLRFPAMRGRSHQASYFVSMPVYKIGWAVLHWHGACVYTQDTVASCFE